MSAVFMLNIKSQSWNEFCLGFVHNGSIKITLHGMFFSRWLNLWRLRPGRFLKTDPQWHSKTFPLEWAVIMCLWNNIIELKIQLSALQTRVLTFSFQREEKFRHTFHIFGTFCVVPCGLAWILRWTLSGRIGKCSFCDHEYVCQVS